MIKVERNQKDTRYIYIYIYKSASIRAEWDRFEHKCTVIYERNVK